MNKPSKKTTVYIVVAVVVLALLISGICMCESIARRAPVAESIHPHADSLYHEESIKRKITDLMSADDYKTLSKEDRMDLVMDLVEQLKVSTSESGHYYLVESDSVVRDDRSISFVSVDQCQYKVLFSVDKDEDTSELLDDKCEFTIETSDGNEVDILTFEQLSKNKT